MIPIIYYDITFTKSEIFNLFCLVLSFYTCGEQNSYICDLYLARRIVEF